METPRASKPEASSPSTRGQREEKRTTGSGTGSSDNDSLASEVGRLSEENAHLSRKLSEILGKAPATPTSSRSGSGLLSGNTGERLRDQVKKLERENRRLSEQNTVLERRISSGKVSATADEVWRLKEENRSLRSDNAQLSSEIEQLNKVASYVGNKVAKVLVGARRANNYNSQLVGELKRWNRRLEEENHRLYNIIDRMQKNGGVGDMANEALSSIHDRGMDGNAKLVKQLEDQNVKLQEEISKLSDHAISLQNLSSSSGSSGSSGILPAPRTPSNHEQDGLRRTLTPDAEARRVAEKLRDVKAERRKSRNLSVESLASEAGDDMERLRRENKKYAEELERIGADLAFVRSQVTLSKELKDSNEQQTLEIQKLTEAASRVAALEEENASQAVEIDRLLEAHTKLEQDAKAARALREDNAQMEEDIFKLADEVERLQPFADKAAELESRVAAYQQELAELRAEHNSSHSSEVTRLKGDNVEVQRTLEALAAEKAVLQAQVRELLEERAQLQGHNKEMDQRLRQMQDRINESAGLKQELSSMSQLRGQSAAYRAQISTLRNENEQLSHKASDLAQQIVALQGRETSGMVRGQKPVDQTAQLEELRAENSSLAAEIQQLRAECGELGAKIVALQKEEAVAVDPEKEEELERLREENKELSAKTSASVLMTVELTTLRNQVSDHKKMEEQFEGLQATLRQLRSEKAALQKDAASVPALKADIQTLRAQVTRAEHAQKAAEVALAAASTTTLSRQDTLSKQHQERTAMLENLQKRNSSVAEELATRDRQLAALQAEHSALSARHEEQGLLSFQSLRKSEAMESEATALRLTLDQERVKAARISKEAAELHALLQTAKAERASLERAVAELRGENAELLTRITDLLARNDEQEKLLASVLAKSNSNGHADPHRLSGNGDGAAHPLAATENPAYVPGRSPERVASQRTATPRPVSPAPVGPRRAVSPRRTRADSSKQQVWRALEDDSLATSAPKVALKAGKTGEAKQPLSKNGKTGLGKFFSFSGKKGAAATASSPAAEKATAAQPPATESDGAMERIAEEQVMTMYERFVDKDDIDGFMAALGFAGFQGPTAPDDMEGAFASAKYACRPERLEGASNWDQLVAHATFELLEAWHGAWLATEED